MGSKMFKGNRSLTQEVKGLTNPLELQTVTGKNVLRLRCQKIDAGKVNSRV